MKPFENIAMYIKELVEKAEVRPSGESINRMVISLLRGLGYDKDLIQPQRRKLKNGDFLHYVVLRTNEESVIIDPSLDSGYAFDKHPLAGDFKGRGRNPGKIKEASDDGLNILQLLQALLVCPKFPVNKERDEKNIICIRATDIRRILKRNGIIASHHTIKDVMSQIEEIKTATYGGVDCYSIDTGVTIIEWVNKSMSFGVLIEDMQNKYVINAQATG